jgi:hypothetical protein
MSGIIFGGSVIADGSVTTAKIADANITAPKLNGAQSGSAPVFGVRAWVNFNGTGTVAIRASGNVSSITDNGTGDYTVNFTTPLPDANYAVSGSCGGGSSIGSIATNDAGTPRTTSLFRFFTITTAGSVTNPTNVDIMVIR